MGLRRLGETEKGLVGVTTARVSIAVFLGLPLNANTWAEPKSSTKYRLLHNGRCQLWGAGGRGRKRGLQKSESG